MPLANILRLTGFCLVTLFVFNLIASLLLHHSSIQAQDTNQPIIIIDPVATATARALESTANDTHATATATADLPSAITPALATHFVSYGETLFTIAQRYGINVYNLAALNDIPDIHVVYLGQWLIIPPREISTPTPTTNTENFVQEAVETLIIPIESTAQPLDTQSPIATALIIATQLPTATTETPEELLHTATPTLIPSQTVNGLELDAFLIQNERVRENIRSIYAIGQSLGRNPHNFSKLGDSTIENPFFMDRFDGDDYNLGGYSYLQTVIDYYRGSFRRDSVAVRVGLHTWSVMDPMWADPYTCNSGENLLACEIRLNNPSVIFIRLGSNDAGIPDSVERNLRRIIEFCIMNGVIPIIGTKADRFDGANSPNNAIIRRLADEYGILLWDFDVLAGTIPNRGLGNDNVHMTSFYAHDWTQPQALRTGHGVHSLTALMALESVMETIGVYPQ